MLWHPPGRWLNGKESKPFLVADASRNGGMNACYRNV